MAIPAQDKMLPDLSGGPCPKCRAGQLATLPDPKLFRCGAKKCGARANAPQGHPVFASRNKHSAQVGEAMLHCTLAGLAVTQVRALLGGDDTSARYIKNRVDKCRAKYVEEREELIPFGNCRYWACVKADEATFRKDEVAGDVGQGESELEDGVAGFWRGSNGPQSRRGGSRRRWR